MRRAPAIALAIVIVSVLLSPWQRELFIGDETKYSQVVREMHAGSVFLPTLNGSPFTHKPPLHFWIVDLLTYVFGLFSIWPYVLPSLVSFGLLLWLMHRFGGPLAAFVCGTSLLMWGSAQTARMDVAFAALLALAAYRIYRANGALTMSAGVATGLAFLVKGPMAPVIILALFAFEAIRRKRKPIAKDALALLPILLLPLLWLIPAIFIGGESYWREIFYKQTVGRAVGAWVHKSPPWFYLVRAPMTLMPWFFLTVAALVAAYRRGDELAKFAASWILAVFVPYTLLSSKLDVYMIAMLPAVALLIARFVDAGDDAWGRRANLVMLSLFAIIGAAGLIVQPRHIREEDGALIARVDVRALFAVLLIAAIVAIVITLRGRLVMSTIATGFVPVAAFAYAALFLLPLANEMASTRPLVRALMTVNAPPEKIALYVCPHLWVRGMDPKLTRARHVDAAELRTFDASVVVVRRRNGPEVADVLQRRQRTGELRMIGKWFDVYE
ncbi:MAG TPA: glycosyltransferase family 39 protein [Thermoanaerobaculia bacterium]|jgi:4-amino-4-deoxy-L-arabinose transferase-like glycosyltransferase|nr:glycosyltransferase family 39 protein [Thermoanaerobaculia bacterium]